MMTTGTRNVSTRALRLRRRLARSLPRRVSRMRMGGGLLADGPAGQVQEERLERRPLAREQPRREAERFGVREERRELVVGAGTETVRAIQRRQLAVPVQPGEQTVG